MSLLRLAFESDFMTAVRGPPALQVSNVAARHLEHPPLMLPAPAHMPCVSTRQVLTEQPSTDPTRVHETRMT